MAAGLIFVAGSLYLLSILWGSYKGSTKHYEISDGVLYNRSDLKQSPVVLSSVREIIYIPRTGIITLADQYRNTLIQIHIDNPISSYFIRQEDTQE